LSKAAATYLNNTDPRWERRNRRQLRPKRVQRRAIKDRADAMPKWLPAAIGVSLTLMICLTVNFRAFSELNHEQNQHSTLNSEIVFMTKENLLLQEEIHYLKTDPKVIEREARKLGLLRTKEKVSVPSKK
jgi:hypothetical protein